MSGRGKRSQISRLCSVIKHVEGSLGIVKPSPLPQIMKCMSMLSGPPLVQSAPESPCARCPLFVFVWVELQLSEPVAPILGILKNGFVGLPVHSVLLYGASNMKSVQMIDLCSTKQSVKTVNKCISCIYYVLAISIIYNYLEGSGNFFIFY